MAEVRGPGIEELVQEPAQLKAQPHRGACSVVLHSRAGFAVVTVSVEGGQEVEEGTLSGQRPAQWRRVEG